MGALERLMRANWTKINCIWFNSLFENEDCIKLADDFKYLLLMQTNNLNICASNHNNNKK